MRVPLKIIAFSGWSHTAKLNQWCGINIDCINHLEQLNLCSNKNNLKNILPQSEKWGIITWSMGTWMGLELNPLWVKNPPSFWIALSPFVQFCGDKNIPFSEAKSLAESFKNDPLRTLKFFRKKHGGLNVLKKETFSEADLACLKNSLAQLIKTTPSTNSIDVPMLSIHGDKDSLVNKNMFNQFSALCNKNKQIHLPKLDHALFYEEPPSVRTEVLDFIHHLKE